MFSLCYNLSYVKCLAEDISANECISGWFNDGISSEGIFIKANNSPEYELNSTSGIPEGWTSYTDYEYSEVRHYELNDLHFDELDVKSIKTEDIKIKKTGEENVNYVSWYDGEPHRYLAEQAMNYTEFRTGEQWYTYSAAIFIKTQNDGDIEIYYGEWVETEVLPSWVNNYFGFTAYKSSSLVNGQPVYGIYNPDSGSPDFFIYDGKNYGINSFGVYYYDTTSYSPLTYWRIKGRGMFINKENDDTNNSFGGDRQVSIGENNNFGGSENKLMVGDHLESEWQGNQLLVGYNNREKGALFAVGNGEYSTSFYPYQKTINNEHSFTLWTTLNDEAFNNPDWQLQVDIRNTDDTLLFLYNSYLNPLTDIESYPYSYNIEVTNDADGATYYAIVTFNRENNNIGITFDLYTDEQHTATYNVLTSTAEIGASVWFNMPYKRDAFLVTSGGDVFIPYFQDKNNTYNLGEAVYNLEQRPQPVQSNWNEGDESSLAYIQNKPDLSQYATKEEVRHYELANKVSSSTENMKIEVVNALPETPAENTIYVIV